MEGRLQRRYGHGSPERMWVRTDSQLSKQRSQAKQLLLPGTKVHVVYYLSRNRHLEHPHFIEVPLSSQEGLFLRDVMNRLNVLRGKRMASLYSWSCKRSYKNGFVWHDLSEDDLIVPSNGNEYVLKGSELFDSSVPDRCDHPNDGELDTPKLRGRKQEPSKSLGSSPNASNLMIKGPNRPSAAASPSIREDEVSPPVHRRTSSSSGNVSNSSIGSDSSPRLLAGYKVSKLSKATNASTQTEGKSSSERRDRSNIGSKNSDLVEGKNNQPSRLKEGSEMCDNESSPPPTTASTPCSDGKMDTLESLIREEARKMQSFRILEEEDFLISNGSKLKATNVLMQLLTCGSISVKDHKSLGLVHTYNPRFSHGNFPSPILGSPMMLGERDCTAGNPKIVRLSSDDTYINESALEMKRHANEEEKAVPILVHSSPFEAERNIRLSENSGDEAHMADLPRSKCRSRTMKFSTGRQVECETMRSPISSIRRASFTAPDRRQPASSIASPNGGSMRFTDASSEKRSSSRLDSFKHNDKIMKFEERLPSGARIMIQSRGPRDIINDASGS